VIVSFSGFNKETMKLVKEYNRKYGRNQPIIVWKPQEHHFGREIQAALDSRIVETNSKDTNAKVNVVDWMVHLNEQPIPPPKTKTQRQIDNFFPVKKQKLDLELEKEEKVIIANNIEEKMDVETKQPVNQE
jgi:hypothetical protein